MWNNGMTIIWEHICHLYYKDIENGLKLLKILPGSSGGIFRKPKKIRPLIRQPDMFSFGYNTNTLRIQ